MRVPAAKSVGVTLLALRPFGQRAKFSARPWKKTNASNASVFLQQVSGQLFRPTGAGRHSQPTTTELDRQLQYNDSTHGQKSPLQDLSPAIATQRNASERQRWYQQDTCPQAARIHLS